MYYVISVALHPARAPKKKYKYVLCHKRRAASSARAISCGISPARPNRCIFTSAGYQNF